MAFVKAHGLTIAANGYIKNMVVETFTTAQEPVAPADAGRIWFNSTLKQFRVTQLSGVGAVIIKTLATDEDLQAYILSVAAQTADASGASLVGYDGNGEALDNFNLSADTVDDTLDALALGIDTVMQSVLDLGSGSLTDIQTEVDAIETVLGTMYDGTDDPDGVYLPPTGSNYLGTTTSITSAIMALDDALMDVSDVADAALPLAGGTMSGSINMGTTNSITNLADPVDALDAANKGYVDAMAQGLSVHAPVKAATTGPILLDGSVVLMDGVALLENDRVLVKNQADAGDNGVYIVGVAPAGDPIVNTPWVRAAAEDGSPVTEFTTGTYFYVEHGSAQEATGWVLDSPNPVEVGTDDINFVQFSSAGLVVAGTGLSKTGNVLAVRLGAGIYEGPAGEVGVEVYGSGGLELVAPSTGLPSSTTTAQLAIKLDGGTLQLGAGGLSVVGSSNSALQDEIDAIETALGTFYDAGDDLYEAPTGSNYIDASTSFTSALTLLDGAIDDEYDRAKGIEDAIITACGLTAATGTLPDWDVAVQYVTGDISLKVAIEDLDAQLYTTSTNLGNAISALGLDTNGEITAWGASTAYVTGSSTYKAAIEALDAQLKTGAQSVYKVTTTTAATSHTITHGLGSEDVTVDVWVADPNDSNKWKNDLVGITLGGSPFNTVVIDLTESRNIKVLVEKFPANFA